VSSYAAYLTGYLPQVDPDDAFGVVYVCVVSFWVVWALFHNGDRE
jgi:hypothetical protein